VEVVEGVTNRYGYLYDAVGRLMDVTTKGYLKSRYRYDANGNRTNAVVNGNGVAAVYDAQDRLLTNGAARYQYNAHGTLTNRIDGSTTQVYVYDTRGSLLQVRIGTNMIAYTVDPLGRRIARTRNGTTTQRIVYQDFLKPIATLHGDGRVDSRFVYATRANVPDYMTRSGQTYRIVTDHLGSVRLVVNAASGVVAQRLDYDEWGQVLNDTNPGFQPFGFAGGLYDPDTGLTRFGYRDYDPTVGRWLAKDPILFEGGQANLYLYCHGDPINSLDPWGLVSVAPTSCIDFGLELIKAYRIYRDARDKQPGHNDIRDAMRHADTSKRVAEDTSLFTSALLGLANEVKNLAYDRQPSGEVGMDLYNNLQGLLSAATGNPINPDQLKTLDPSSDSYTYGGGCGKEN